MINEKWTPKFKKWLEEGKESSENIVETPWDVNVIELENFDLVQATLPSIPFEINIIVGIEYATLCMDMGYPTDTLDTIAKMRLFKKLLNMNREYKVLKTTLIGEEENVNICIDLDLASLNEKEFNNALTAMIFGGSHLVNLLGLGEEIQRFMESRTIYKILEMKRDGKTAEDILNYLMNRVGASEDIANAFLNVASKNDHPKADEHPEVH